MAVSGVRSSCETVPTKSSFIRSSSFRSVISRAIVEALDDQAIPIQDGRHGQRDIDPPTVLGQVDRLQPLTRSSLEMR